MENDTSLPYSVSVSFIEAPIFSKLVYDYLSEDEYAALQWTLAARPESGKVISGTGGSEKSGGRQGEKGSAEELELFIFVTKQMKFGY